jgi:hypothetical protein
MKIEFICEGPIDSVLLKPLISAIAKISGVSWPVNPSEDLQTSYIRKSGFGGVQKRIEAILKMISKGIYARPDILVIAIDHYKTENVREIIKDLIAELDFCVLAIPVQEIEAWWLGDRMQVLAWSGLNENFASKIGYGPGFSPESILKPKVLLNKITEISDRIQCIYGNDGSLEVAEDFVDLAWNQQVNLESIKFNCPQGFVPFFEDIENSIKDYLKKSP